jgi:acetyl-CoA C-acetyltransferase
MDIVLIDGARTPHGTLLGSLSDVSAIDLGATALEGLLDRIDIAPGQVEYVVLGNAIQAGLGQVPARQVTVRTALPDDTPTTTINEASGSGVRALALARDHLVAGRAEFAVGGGFESMTNAPWILPGYRKGKRYGDVLARDSMLLDALWDLSYDAHMGELTEDLVERFDLAREDQDRYALESHTRAAAAINSGAFDPEIVPVKTPEGVVERDEGPRPESTLETLGSLATPFREEGTITAGNASKLADGAGVALLATAAAAEREGLDPMLEFVDYALAYRDPRWFNVAVGKAIDRVLAANELVVEDIDVFEVNEAFAAQMVYVMRHHDVPRERLNPRGGAIAFGHPIGASGGMLVTSLAYEMREEGAEYGLLGMSIGGGGGIMSLWRNPDA